MTDPITAPVRIASQLAANVSNAVKGAKKVLTDGVPAREAMGPNPAQAKVEAADIVAACPPINVTIVNVCNAAVDCADATKLNAALAALA